MIPLQRIHITRLTNQDCFRIKTKDKVIICDPGYIGSRDQQGFTTASFEKADVILISHHHFDHLNPQLLDQLVNENTVIIAPEKCVEFTDKKIKVVQAGDHFTINEIDIQVVNAYNTPQGKSNPKNHPKGEGVGYVFRLTGKTFYFAGDTDVIEDMAHLGAVDVAFLPMSGIYVMDPHEVLEAVEIIKPQLVILMHQLNEDPLVVKKVLAENNSPCMVLTPNETLTL